MIRMGLDTCFTQLLGTGFIHADPHYGNMLFTGDQQLALLDFGLVTSATPAQKDAMAQSVLHTLSENWVGLMDDLRRLDMIPSQPAMWVDRKTGLPTSHLNPGHWVNVTKVAAGQTPAPHLVCMACPWTLAFAAALLCPCRCLGRRLCLCLCLCRVRGGGRGGRGRGRCKGRGRSRGRGRGRRKGPCRCLCLCLCLCHFRSLYPPSAIPLAACSSATSSTGNGTAGSCCRCCKPPHSSPWR